MDEKELRRRRKEIEKIAKAQTSMTSRSENKPKGCTPSFGFLIKWLITLGFASWTAYLVLILLLAISIIVLFCFLTGMIVTIPFLPLVFGTPTH